MTFEDDDDKGPSCFVDRQCARVVEPVQLLTAAVACIMKRRV